MKFMIFLKKTFYIIICLFMFSICTPILLYAGEVNVLEGFIIGDDEGIKVSSNGKYFTYANDLYPGDTIKNKIDIKNTRQDKAFNLYIASGEMFQNGNIGMNDRIRVTISLDDEIIFKGRPDGSGIDEFADTNMKHTPKYLGYYLPDQSKKMYLQYDFLGDELKPEEFGDITFEWIFNARSDEDFLPTTSVKDFFNINSILVFIILLETLVSLYMYIVIHK